MIVRYARERGYKGEGKDPHLTLNKNYIVFGINFRPDSLNYPQRISVLSDAEQYPGIWELSYFDFVNETVPNDWIFDTLEDGYFRLCPKEFTGDFWDEFHDGNEKAEAIFELVKNKLENFHQLKET